MHSFRRLSSIVATILVTVSVVAAVTPTGPAAATHTALPMPMQAIVPARLLETRPGEVTVDGQSQGIGQRPAGSTTEVQIAGRGGVPNDADAAFINLTAVSPAGYTYLTAYPCDAGLPNASTLNSPPGDVRANSALVKLSASGSACIYTVAATDMLVDVTGYVASHGLPTSMTPARMLETRAGEVTVDGQLQGIGQRPAGSITEVQIGGRAGVPADASAVFINLTAASPAGFTYLTAFPCSSTLPNASNLNSPPGDVRATGVFVQLSPTGSACIYTVAPSDIIVDVTGYVPAKRAPTSMTPARLLESRPGQITADGQSQGIGQRPAGSVTEVQIAGRAGIPIDATAAFINVTAASPAGYTYLTAYACDGTRPNTSNLNSPPGDVRANNAFVKLSATGTACVYTVAPTDLIVDVNGYVAQPCTVDGVAVASALPNSECQALAAFYNATNGPRWAPNLRWMTEYDPCTVWWGVSCTNGRVEYIDLTNSLLNGPIPPEFGNLTNLKVLTLDDHRFQKPVVPNKITSLPPEIGKLTKLEELYLDNNELSDLPPEIGNLTKLRKLYLAGNNLTSLPPEIGNLTNLTELPLYGNNLTSLSPELTKLTKLPKLSLADNNLTSLPPEIGNLKVGALDLSNNNLTSLPPEIGNLGAGTLDLSGNNLTSLPPEIGNLKVGPLNLSNNNLTSLPPEIGNISGLTALDVSNNNLTSLPAEIGKFVTAVGFDFSNNNLTSLPAEIGNFPHLEALDVSNNSLSSLPPEIGQLTALLNLKLPNNNLSDVPPEIGQLTALRTLYLNNNNLSGVRPEIGNLKEIRALALDHNMIYGDVTEAFAPLRSTGKVTYLTLNHNNCVWTPDPGLAAWLYNLDSKWDLAC